MPPGQQQTGPGTGLMGTRTRRQEDCPPLEQGRRPGFGQSPRPTQRQGFGHQVELAGGELFRQVRVRRHRLPRHATVSAKRWGHFHLRRASGSRGGSFRAQERQFESGNCGRRRKVKDNVSKTHDGKRTACFSNKNDVRVSDKLVATAQPHSTRGAHNDTTTKRVADVAAANDTGPHIEECQRIRARVEWCLLLYRSWDKRRWTGLESR